MQAAPHWTAVVLAGGRGARMGGVDKPQILLAGRSLLAHVLGGLSPEVPVIVVGPEQPTPRPVSVVRESPPFGGPVAALAAAVPLVTTPAVALVAGDMPHVGPLITRLANEWSGEGARVPVDMKGRRQPMCSVFDVAALRVALAGLGDPSGASMRALLDRMDVRERHLDADESAALRDVDAPEDLDRLS